MQQTINHSGSCGRRGDVHVYPQYFFIPADEWRTLHPLLR